MASIYTPQPGELFLLWPVLVLIATVGMILIGSLVVSREGARTILPGIAIIGLIAAVTATVRLYLFGLAQSPGRLLAGSVVFDNLNLFASLIIPLLLIGVISLAMILWRDRPIEWPVFLSLLIGGGVGMILLASTVNLLMFIIAVELASLSSYVLVGFRRFSPGKPEPQPTACRVGPAGQKQALPDRKAAEGATKYVIFGSVCSGLMLYGISMLFGLTGSFDFVEISKHLAGGAGGIPAMIALGCLFIGLGFKISLVPMHFWCPDAFEAAGAEVAAWLSVASKSVALIALARFVQILVTNAPEFQQYIYWTITGCAIVTMTLANLSAYWQTSVKRILAYSSIAHAGYMVCGVVLFNSAGVGAILAYVVVYLLMNFGAFAVAGIVERATGSDQIDEFRQLGTRSPVVAALMMVFLFSLVGMPPLAGFAAKWILLAELWQGGSVLLIAAILANTVLSLFYYMRLARAMYFEQSDKPPLKVPVSFSAMLGVCAAGLLIVFIGWGMLSEFTKNLASTILG